MVAQIFLNVDIQKTCNIYSEKIKLLKRKERIDVSEHKYIIQELK